jgi:hypothetical protein
VPTIVLILENDADLKGQFLALDWLGSMRGEAEAAVPALIRTLRKEGSLENEFSTRRLDATAARALGRMLEKARAAVPELERLAREGHEDARHAAQLALTLIGRPTAP